MQYKLLFILTFFIPIFSFAQNGSLKVQVLDQSTQKPIVGASVQVLTTTAKALIKGEQTNQTGNVLLKDVVSGSFSLRVSYVGYKDLNIPSIVIKNKEELNLGTLYLEESRNQISEVVVQGKVPELQLGIDRKIFDVSQSMVSVGGTAQDLLANVPTLQVDSDGSVSLRGSTSVRILIDGKESAMAGSDINKLLQSLPADAVSKVEIITNPSAKYDAEGQSGIINIVLKKNLRTGLNGSVNASAGNYDNYNAGVMLNYRDSKFNYFGSYNYRNGNNVGEGSVKTVGLINGQETALSPTTITDSESFRKGINNSFRLGVDYFASEKTTLSLASNLSIRDNNRGEDIFYKNLIGQTLVSESPRTSRQFEEDLGYDLSFDFKQVLKREGEEITANITYGNDREDGRNNFKQTFLNSNRRSVRENTTSEKGKNWNFQLDYVLPLGENHRFEAGYRSILRNGNEFQLSDTLQGTVFQPDYTVSNDFGIQSGVHALYVNYQRMLNEKIGVQAGLRAEDAYLNTDMISFDPNLIQQGEEITKGQLDYFRLYPSLFLSYNVNEQGDKVQLSYSRRVQRPRGWQVNPFVNVSDPVNIRQGNPNLMPEDIHAVELSFAKTYDKWNFVSSAYYRRVNDMTQPFQYDETDPIAAQYLVGQSNATFMRWENVGSRNNLGFELVSKVNIFNWWDATINANLFYFNVNPNEQYNVRSTDGFSWNGNITSNVKFSKTTSFQIRGDYRAPMNSLQGRMKAMNGLDVALKQDVLKGKGSIMFNVRDLFDTRRFGGESFLPTRYSDFHHRWAKRTFNISFSYRFGIQDMNKSKRANEERRMDEDGAGGY